MKKLLMIVMLIGAVGLAGVANAGVLDLSAAPADQSSEGWGFTANLAFDNNFGTKNSTQPYLLPPIGGSAGEWLWVDMGQDYELNTVSIHWTTLMGSTFTLRTLPDGGGDHTDPGAYATVGTAVGLDGTEGAPRGEAWETWDFAAGTVTVAGGGGTAAVDETNPIGRYLMMHVTVAGDSIWGLFMINEMVVDADIPVDPIPEPAGLGLLGVALLAMRRRRS